MRLCSYVVKNDTGFAPNPFWGCCTLAACTPNHQGVRLARGDWILGNQTAARGNGLVYAMEVAETLPFDDYYRDPRFEKKKPVPRGTWRKACGDNMYYRDSDDEWKQHPSRFHTSPGQMVKDQKYARVFISEVFYYFGKHAVHIPKRFGALVRRRQGCSCRHDEAVVRRFVGWLRGRFEPGIHGLPAHAAVHGHRFGAGGHCDNGCTGRERE